MSYHGSQPGSRGSGSDKVRYYQSHSLAEKGGKVEPYVVTGSYGPSTGYYPSSSSSVPRSGRKYEVDRVTPGNSRTCLVIVIIVGVAILVAAAIALGIVFGVVNKPGDKSGTPTSTPDAVVSYDSSLTLDRPYTSAYDDPTTAEYQSLANELLPGVNDALETSELGDALIDTQHLGFQEGSIIALFRSFFKAAKVVIEKQETPLTATLVQTKLVAQLTKKTTFVQSQKLLLNQITVKQAANNGRKDLGESCTVNADCSDDGAECLNSKCTCMSNYYHSNNNANKGGRCITKIQHGASGCTEGRHCVPLNAVCLNSKCSCGNERFYKENVCVAKIAINQPGCSVASECITEGAVCSAKICRCPDTQIYTGGRCKIGINQSGCTQASDCATPNAVCTGLTCICDTNKFYKDGACVNKLAIYEKGCSADSHCSTPNAACSSEVCRCPDTRFYQNGQCLTKIAINTAGCSNKFQCATSGAMCDMTSGTSTGTCKCPSTHTYTGGRCVNNQDCSTWYSVNLVYLKCMGALTKMSMDTPEGKCWHYENFMGCVKYSSVVQDVDCSWAVIDNFVPGQSICDGHDYDYLDSLLASTRSGLCQSASAARYMVRYNCLTYDPKILGSDEDRCRALLTLEGCVYSSLNYDAGCHMTDVAALMKSDMVRSDLLKDIPDNCDTLLSLTPCEKAGLQTALVNQYCLYAPTQFHFATILAGDINTMNNYNSQKKVKCSVYEEALKCMIDAGGEALSQCTPADLASTVKAAARMFYDVMSSPTTGILPAQAIPFFKRIDFSDCDAALSSVVATGQCPSSGAVADLVVASGVAQVWEATRYTKENVCLKYPAFETVLNQIRLPNAEKCREDHVWTSISENLAYIRTAADGFDPFVCKENKDKKCSVNFAEAAKTGECKEPYGKMMAAQTAYDKCRHFEAFLKCLKLYPMRYDEDCPFTKLRDLVRSTNPLMNDRDICHACDHPWMIKDNNDKWSGFVNVRIQPVTEDAIIYGLAYDLLSAGLEYVGIGISQNNIMSQSDIYTVQATTLSGENWTILDRYASAKAKPATDDTQGGQSDITPVMLDIVNGNGIAIFHRKIDTGDAATDVTLTGNRYLLFARGPMTSDTVPDLSKHTFKKVSEMAINFTCSPYDFMEAKYPQSLADTCSSPALHRHLWEYNCIDFDFSVIPDANDRCRTEISRRKCVYNILDEAGLPCTLDDVISMSQLPVVRAGLLDHVDIGCESELTGDTECVRSYISEAIGAQECFSPIFTLNSFVYFDNIENVDAYTSADGQKPLKCSIFEEHIKCYLNKFPVASTGTTCKMTDVAPAVTSSAHIAYNIHFAGKDKPELSYQSCEGSVPSEVPARTCPSRAAVADMVLAKCGPLVLTALGGSTENVCEKGGPTLTSCLADFYMLNSDLCEADHLMKSLEEYADFIRDHMGGYHVTACKDKSTKGKRCSAAFIELMKVDSVCGASYRLLQNAKTDMEKCSMFGGFLGCVKFQVVAGGENCSFADLESLAKQHAGMGDYDLCKACQFRWVINDNSGVLAGEILIDVIKQTESNTQNDVIFTLKAYDFNEETDWVGLGVSYDQYMTRSDIYTIQKKDGNWVVTDRYVGDNKVKPNPDSDIAGTSDATLESAHINNGNLIARFIRKIDTQDTKDVSVYSDRQLLYARGPLSNGDISKHTFKKSSDIYLFMCDPYQYLEDTVPKTLAEVCRFAPSIRFYLESFCLYYNISSIADENDRCRAELGRRYCVYNNLKNAGCTEANIEEAFQAPELRLGLLDHTDPNCESGLQDSKCETHYFKTADMTSSCMSPLISFYSYAAMTTTSDSQVDAILSADGTTPLKCSVLQEATKCILLKGPDFATANDGNTPCTSQSLLNALQKGSAIYFEVAMPGVTVREVSLQSCSAGLSTTFPTKACPSSMSVANIVAAGCSQGVIQASATNGDVCGTFNQCFKDLEFIGEDMCQTAGYFDNVLVEYNSFLKQRFNNVVDPAACRSNMK